MWLFKAGEDPEDPGIFLAVFGSIGAIFLLIGLELLLAEAHHRSLLRRAYESGHYVMAKIAGVRQQQTSNRGAQYPYVLECHYTDPDTGVAHVYFSRPLYVNAQDLLTSDEVPVYIDRMREDVGFVDVDAVLPKIKIHR